MIFTWDDLKGILLRKKKMILRSSLWIAACVLIYLVRLPLQYESRGTFKQSSKVDQSFDLKNLIRSISTTGVESAAATIMLSDTVLGKTVEELGLQVEMNKRNTIFRNILAELGRDVKNEEAARFSHVKYRGEKTKQLTFKKTSDTHYEIYEFSGKLLAVGSLGKSIALTDAVLTVDGLKESVTLSIYPLQSSISKLRKTLSIKPSREDKNLLVLKVKNPCQRLSASIVNTIMAMYEKYLIDENKLLIGAQLSYLNMRQDELSQKLDREIEHHAHMLKNNLQNHGRLGLKDELEYVLQPLHAYEARLDKVELELKQIQERRKPLKLDEKTLLVERYSSSLAEQIGSAKKLLSRIDQKEKIDHVAPEELTPAIELYNAALDSNDTDQQKEIAQIVRDFMSQQESRQSSIQETSNWIKTIQPTMSLESAREQFNAHCTQLDNLQAELKQVVFMRDHLYDPNFEICTLSNVLHDPITQNMVQRAMDLEEKLHDDMHRSQRDHGRLKTTLTIQKRFLASHLDQSLSLGKVRIDLLNEKISSLGERMEMLLDQEKNLLLGKIEELKSSMLSLPDLWLHENRLKFKSELTKGMMEGLVHMAETKNLSHHLYQVESRPLDPALQPLSFVKPRLLGITFLAFAVSVLALSMFFTFYAFVHGFPASLATLQAIGAHTSGKISEHDTIRKLAHFLLKDQKKGVVAIIGEKQPSFYSKLSEILHKHQKTCCVIDCSLGKIATADETPGLHQALLGYTPMFRKSATYDFLPIGAAATDNMEHLQSEKMALLIQSLREQYDFLLLISKTKMDSIDSESILTLSTHGILMSDDPLDVAARQKGKYHVTFIE